MNITSPRLAAIALSGIVALGLLGAGVVAAQEPSDPSGRPAAIEARHHRPALKGLIALFKASGLDRETFAEGFQEGLTVGEVLEANGLDPQVVVADALALIEERVDQAVADGVIDEARGAEILANAEQGLQSLLDVTPRKPERPGRRAHRVHALHIAAETIGIAKAELREALAGGGTIAEVAGANGVDPQDVIDAMLAPLFERIDAAVENGRLSAEDGEAKKAAATERLTEFVLNGSPAGRQAP